MADKELTSIQVLDMIIKDCEADVKEYDGKPFNGRTLGELHGVLEAKILALATIMKKEIQSKDSNETTK